MYCSNCGKELKDNVKFCGSCGVKLITGESENPKEKPQRSLGAGYSSKINDPAFGKYIKNTNRWSGIFSVILALAAVIGFYIYGERSSEMDNPQALYIGLGIGGMFILIAFFQILGRKRSKTWDGTVVDKKIAKKSRRRSTTDDDYYYEDYTEFNVYIRSDKGKKHTISVENNDTIYNYYQVGDRVRHHAGLNSYEKFDKSKDAIIFCNACGSLNNIEDDFCFRCKCPLLK